MPETLIQTVAPTEEPVSIADAKAHLRIDGDEENGHIGDLIKAARAHVEEITSRQLVSATWQQNLTCWPAGRFLRLQKPPLVSITHVKYIDSNGTLQTWDSSNYQVDTAELPPGIMLAPTASWPTLNLDYVNPVRVTFVAGYGAAASVPADLRHAVKLLVSHFYELREPVIVGTSASKAPLSIDALIEKYRYRRVA